MLERAHAHSPALRRRLTTGLIAAAVVSGTAFAAGPAASAASQNLTTLVKSVSAGSTLTLASGTYVFSDFSSNLHGVTLNDVGIKGAGVGKTIIEMTPNTSTKAGSVPTATGSPNPLYLVYTAGGTPGLSGFTLQGTSQGHLYGGLFVGTATNARISNISIAGISGSSNQPPGETDALADYKTTGSVYNNITIVGGNTAAVDFGSNSATNITVENSTFTGTEYSSGMAMWETKNITLDNDTIENNRSGINFERASGTITLNEPVFSNNRLYDMQFGTDQTGATVVINNPVLASGQKLKINSPTLYHGVTNGQKRANIHVYVNGVDKTSSLVQYN